MEKTTDKSLPAGGEHLLTRAQSAALRGVAILGIILHNYCHFLKFAVKENEYTFDSERPRMLLERLLAHDEHWLVHLFSFFGHYGVPVFLFVSGFGLVMKYERRQMSATPSAAAFVWNHFRKLFRLMAVGYALFVAVYFLRNDNGVQVYSWDRVAAQLTMTINFLYTQPDRIIKPGPYWFFGLMMQLYLIYIYVFHRRRSARVLLAAVAGCWLLQWVSTVWNPFPHSLLNLLRYNFVGGMLPFALGIAYGRWGRQVSAMGCAALAVASGVAVFVGSFWLSTWLWVPLFVVVGAVATVRLLPAWPLQPLAWVGGVSATLFVMHPLLREVVLSHYRQVDLYYGIGIYLLASVSAAMWLRHLLSQVSPTQDHRP